MSETGRRGLPAWTRLPALLLIAVALCQIALARGAQLSAWSGGGFGMFSTTDVWGRRHLHAELLMPGARRELAVPRELRELEARALALPSESRLRALARRLWETAPVDDSGDAVSLAVYATRFDPSTLAPSGTLLNAGQFERTDATP